MIQNISKIYFQSLTVRIQSYENKFWNVLIKEIPIIILIITI